MSTARPGACSCLSRRRRVAAPRPRGSTDARTTRLGPTASPEARFRGVLGGSRVRQLAHRLSFRRQRRQRSRISGACGKLGRSSNGCAGVKRGLSPPRPCASGPTRGPPIPGTICCGRRWKNTRWKPAAEKHRWTTSSSGWPSGAGTYAAASAACCCSPAFPAGPIHQRHDAACAVESAGALRARNRTGSESSVGWAGAVGGDLQLLLELPEPSLVDSGGRFDRGPWDIAVQESLDHLYPPPQTRPPGGPSERPPVL